MYCLLVLTLAGLNVYTHLFHLREAETETRQLSKSPKVIFGERLDIWGLNLGLPDFFF